MKGWYPSKTCTALTAYLKPKESEEKVKRPPHYGDNGKTGVTTGRLTCGKISSPSQPYCCDSAKDCNKTASMAASMEQFDNCFNKRRHISTPTRSRCTNTHSRTHYQVTCIKIKAAWPHTVHPIRISQWSLGREVEKTKERRRKEQEAGKGWGRDS